MSSDVQKGFSKMRIGYSLLESLEKLRKELRDARIDNKRISTFKDAIKENKEKGVPLTVDSSTVTFFNTKGVGSEQMRQMLDDCNIPSITLSSDSTKETIIAVPKQYDAQATSMIAMAATQNLTNPDRIVNLSPAQKQFIESIKGTSPQQLTAAQATLLNNKSQVFQMHNTAAEEMSTRLSKQNVPHCTIQRDGLTTIVFPPAFLNKAQTIHQEMLQTPSHVKYNEFARNNLGKDMHIYSGLSQGQIDFIHRELSGSSTGYCIDDKKLFFTPEQASHVEPVLYEAMMYKRILDKQFIHSDSLYNDILKLSKAGKEVHFQDAENPHIQYTINRSGLHQGGPEGRIIAAKTDESFEKEIKSAVKSMTSPICEEIAKSKEAIAMTNVESAEMYAAQIACLGGKPDQNTLNVLVGEIKLKADTVEGELTRFDADELKDKLGIDSSLIDDYTAAINSLTSDELKALEGELQSMKENIIVPKKRPVTKDAQSLEEINDYFEKKDNEVQISEDGRQTQTVEYTETIVEDVDQNLKEHEDHSEISLEDFFGGNE